MPILDPKDTSSATEGTFPEPLLYRQDVDIYAAINAVMAEVSYVQKTKAAALKYHFASEGAYISALRPSMVKHGIIMLCQEYMLVAQREYTTSSGTKMMNTIIKGVWKFHHAPTKTETVSEAYGEASDTSDKSFNKAMTASKKYAMNQTFLMETGDDPDQSQGYDQADNISQTDEPPLDSPELPAQPNGDISKWPPSQVELFITKKQFLNSFECLNAFKLSNVLVPGVTGTKGLEFWVDKYKDARILDKEQPKAAAAIADEAFTAEKARQAQDESTGA